MRVYHYLFMSRSDRFGIKFADEPEILRPSLFQPEDKHDHHHLGRNQTVMDGLKSTFRDILSSEHYELSKLFGSIFKGAGIGALVGTMVLFNRHNIKKFHEVLFIANSGTYGLC